MATLTARIPDEIVQELNEVSSEEQIDKSTAVRKLLADSLGRWREDRAARLYQKKVLSAEQAAHYAKVSLWRFFDLLKEKNVFVNYDAEEFEEDLKAIKWSRR